MNECDTRLKNPWKSARFSLLCRHSGLNFMNEISKYFNTHPHEVVKRPALDDFVTCNHPLAFRNLVVTASIQSCSLSCLSQHKPLCSSSRATKASESLAPNSTKRSRRVDRWETLAKWHTCTCSGWWLVDPSLCISELSSAFLEASTIHFNFTKGFVGYEFCATQLSFLPSRM